MSNKCYTPHSAPLIILRINKVTCFQFCHNSVFQVQLRWKVFLSGAYEAFNRNDRRIYHSQQPVAGQESESAQQARHDSRHLVQYSTDVIVL